MSNGLNSLAEKLQLLFGQTEEERERARNWLMENPAEALAEIGLEVDEKVIEHLETLEEEDKRRIIERLERVSMYNTDLQERHSERMDLLEELVDVFEVFLQYEDPEELGRGGW